MYDRRGRNRKYHFDRPRYTVVIGEKHRVQWQITRKANQSTTQVTMSTQCKEKILQKNALSREENALQIKLMKAILLYTWCAGMATHVLALRWSHLSPSTNISSLDIGPEHREMTHCHMFVNEHTQRRQMRYSSTWQCVERSNVEGQRSNNRKLLVENHHGNSEVIMSNWWFENICQIIYWHEDIWQ